MRLIVAAIRLVGGVMGIYTFVKHRNYVSTLPADPENDILKPKFKWDFWRALAFVAPGAWWALSYWFPGLRIRFK